MPMLLFGQQRDPEQDLTETSTGSDMDSVAELLSKLETMKAAEEPPQPQKVGVGRRIFGSIGDALAAAAAARVGAAPPRAAFREQLIQRQRDYHAARAEYDERQREIDRFILESKMEMAKSSEERMFKAQAERDARARERQAAIEEENRIRERQRIDDERDAEIALAKWNREHIVGLQEKLLEAGVTDSIIPPVDPAKLTWAQMQDIDLRVRAALTGEGTTDVDRLKHQLDVAKEIDPNMTMSGIAFSTDDGVPNAKFIAPASVLTGTDYRTYEQLGINPLDPDGNPRPAADLRAEAAALGKQDRDLKIKEREARLAAVVKRGKQVQGTVGTKVSEHLTLMQNAQVALTLLSGSAGSPGGPIAGRIPPGLRYMALQQFGDKRAAEVNKEVTIRIQNLFNVVAKIRSGAAVTLPEEIRLMPELANMTDLKGTMITKLRLLVEFEQRFLDNLQKQHGLTDEDLDYVSDGLADPYFVPAELESGDIVIFGGD